MVLEFGAFRMNSVLRGVWIASLALSQSSCFALRGLFIEGAAMRGAVVRGAAAEAMAARAAGSGVLASDAIAGRSFAGFGVRASGGVAEMELVASQRLASSATFRRAFSEIAARTELPLALDAGGFIRVAGSRLGISRSGAVVLTQEGSGISLIIARIEKGQLMELDVTGRSVNSLGLLRGTVDETVRLSTRPAGASAGTLRAGSRFNVIRMVDGWLEIESTPGVSTAWILAPLVALETVMSDGSTAGVAESSSQPQAQGCVPLDSARFVERLEHRTGSLVVRADAVDLIDGGTLRFTVLLTNRRTDGRSLAVGLKAEGSDGIADYWKFMPSARGNLTDDLGTSYRLTDSQGLPFGRESNDWLGIPPGEEIPVTFLFEGIPLGPCPRHYSLAVELWLWERDADNVVRRRPAMVYLRGMQRPLQRSK